MLRGEASSYVDYLSKMFRRWNGGEGPSLEERKWWVDRLLPYGRDQAAKAIEGVIELSGMATNPNRKIFIGQLREMRSERISEPTQQEQYWICYQRDSEGYGKVGHYQGLFPTTPTVTPELAAEVGKYLHQRHGGLWRYEAALSTMEPPSAAIAAVRMKAKRYVHENSPCTNPKPCPFCEPEAYEESLQPRINQLSFVPKTVESPRKATEQARMSQKKELATTLLSENRELADEYNHNQIMEDDEIPF